VFTTMRTIFCVFDHSRQTERFIIESQCFTNINLDAINLKKPKFIATYILFDFGNRIYNS
jgi:hypothetical protein